MQAGDDLSAAAVFARSRTLLAVLAVDGTLLRVSAGGAGPDGLLGAAAIGGPLWAAEGWGSPAVEAAVRRAAGGQAGRCELELQVGGTRRWLALSVAPLRERDGAVERLLVEGHDVSEWKLDERCAREATRYRAVVDTQTEWIVRQTRCLSQSTSLAISGTRHLHRRMTTQRIRTASRRSYLFKSRSSVAKRASTSRSRAATSASWSADGWNRM